MVNVHDIPPSNSDKGDVRRAFAKYGDISDVIVRQLISLEGGQYCDAKIIYANRTEVKMDELFTDEIKLGDKVVTVTERRLAAQDLTSMSVPNEKRPQQCTLQIRIVKAVGVPAGMNPFVRLQQVYSAQRTDAVAHAHIAPSEGPESKTTTTVQWMEDSTFAFHIDEAVEAFNFSLHDAVDWTREPTGSATIDLSQLRDMAGNTPESLVGSSKDATFDMLDGDGNIASKLTVHLAFGIHTHIPQWAFTTDFAADNAALKPPHCGVAGWVQRKDPQTGVFKQQWMYIMMSPPQLCFLDNIHTEFEVRAEASRVRASGAGEHALMADAIGVQR